MRHLLRRLRTRILYGQNPCTVCGRRPYTPGAITADVCEDHFRQRLLSVCGCSGAVHRSDQCPRSPRTT